MRSVEDPGFESRLAAAVLGITAVVCAAIAAAGTVALAVWALTDPDEIRETFTFLWPLATALLLPPYLWATVRFARAADRHVRRGGPGHLVAGWGAAALGLGSVWLGAALPFYGLIFAVVLAPVVLAGLGLVLLVVRLVRSAAQRRAG